jgi:aldehyde dehydrogenase (NAD+)
MIKKTSKTKKPAKAVKTVKVVKAEKKSKGFKIDYSPSLEGTSIVSIKPRNELFIGGKFVAPKSNKYFDTINPATGEKISELALANKDDVDSAVKAARQAYNGEWGKMSGKDRGRLLFRVARILQERAREFAVLETLDGGKPIKESRDVDVPLAAQHFFYHAGWADKLDYLAPNKKVSPVGVCGQIIPWNFPLLMAAWKLAPALACGNTVVLKPAETTSLTALLLADVFNEAGFPAGVVNIITGAGETGAALVNHPDVNKIAFTGSTDVGKLIAKSIAHSNKKLSLELGGKSANIIFADAAIDQAIEGVVNGIYFNQGHVCCAGSRLLVEESIVDEVVKKLQRRLDMIRVGNPLDKNTDLGAINSLEQLNKIKELVDLGKKEGGDFYQSSSPLPKKGYYFAPCMFSNVTSAHTLNRIEIFGPVLTIQTFRTPDEAITKANDSRYGLAAGIWSEKGSKNLKIAGALKAGVIWVNTYNKFDAASPFGGFAESGWGREGGRHGLFSYLKID